MRTLSCVMCRAGSSLDIDGDQKVAMTGARGRRLTRLIIIRRHRRESLCLYYYQLNIRHPYSSQMTGLR